MNIYKDITLLIVSFKSDNAIQKILNNLGKNFKIIICENSNNLEFKNKIESQFPNCEIFLTGENLGVSKAVNIGLKKIKTKYAIFLTPDTLPQKNCFEKLYNIANSSDEIAIVAPRNLSIKLNKSFGYFSKFSTKKNDQFILNEKYINVDWVFGCAMLFNMKNILRVGFFDENFFLDFEEIDLCFRLREKNYKIILSFDSLIISEPQKSVETFNDHNLRMQRMWHFGWSSFYFYKKHYGFYLSFLKTGKVFFVNFLKMIYHLIFLKKNTTLNYIYYFYGYFSSVLGYRSYLRKNL